MRARILLFVPLLVLPLHAQQANTPETAMLQKVIDRLDALERQNRELADEVRSLREDLRSARAAPTTPEATEAAADSQPPLDERVAVDEQRIAEQAQTKVESSQKLPLKLTGMLLFNAFSASKIPTGAAASGLAYAGTSSGASLRQSQLGLQFQGPQLPGDGRVHGFLSMDFFNGPSYLGSDWLRIRRGVVSFDWQDRSISFGQDKPLIAPRQPNSLAEVGVPPLADAGNLWLWLPQARYEERHNLGTSSGFIAQAALMQTAEDYAAIPKEYADSLERVRPALEGRIAFWHKFDDVRRFEIAPSFHLSTTHIAATSVASHIASFDWLIVPWSKMEISGTAFRGQNVSNLGALDQGFTFFGDDKVRPVHSSGGWAQISMPIASRLTWNLFSGFQSDRARDLSSGSIARNLAYASNLMYRIGPNVLIGLEGLQTRTRVVSGPEQVQNRYDLAVAYLF
jgi:hypothetical protein